MGKYSENPYGVIRCRYTIVRTVYHRDGGLIDSRAEEYVFHDWVNEGEQDYEEVLRVM